MVKKYWFNHQEDSLVPGVAAFRGIAAFLVFIFHFYGFFLNQKPIHYLGIDFSAIFKAGHIGVDIFFVLSGFLLFLSFGKLPKENKVKSCAINQKSLHTIKPHSSSKKNQVITNFWQNTFAFWRRRFWRLYPLAALFSIAVFGMQLMLHYLHPSATPWHWGGELKNLIFHLLFIQSLSIKTYWELNPVMWTLTLEMLFIIILPIFLYLGRHKKIYFILLLLVLTSLNLYFRGWIAQFFPQIIQNNPDPLHDARIFYSEQLWGRFDQFALGVLVGIIWLNVSRQRINLLPSLSALITGIFGLIIAFLIFARLGGDFRESIYLQIFLHFFTAGYFALYLFGFISLVKANIKPFWKNLIQDFFAPTAFAYFGQISYGFFLWHFPILSLLHKIHLSPLIAFFSAFALSIIASTITLYAIEKTLCKMAKRAWQK